MRVAVLALAAALVFVGKAEDSILLNVQKKDPAVVLEWHSKLRLPLAGLQPEYKIEWSPDLTNWQPLGNRVLGGISVNDETIRQAIVPPDANAFYRLSARLAVAHGEKSSDGIYGYASQFSRNLQQLGQLPLETFVEMYAPTNEYRAALTYDPTTARFFEDFNTDPAVYNQTHTNDHRLYDFRFNADELAIFKTNGFVVSQRLGSYSFADAFYKVYIDDLPVFVSTDSLLHAWHRNYVTILSEIETSFLSARFGTLLTNMAAQIPALNAEAANTPLAQGVLDADYYLAVAKSLLSGTNDPGYLNQSARINQALSAVATLTRVDFDFYGEIRPTDFSQFKVRGHYGDTPYLQNYFRAMMWCGIVDFRFNDARDRQSLREFSIAAALTQLLNRSDSLQKWIEFDQVIRNFVGFPDCMNFAQLSDLLAAGNFAAPYDNLSHIYQKLWTGDLGIQNIRATYVYSPNGPQEFQLPRSFAMMPQRFIVDSWTLSKVVFDSIFWDEDGIPTAGDKVQRRVPSSLDVAFSVLGNDQIVPEIAARIADPNGHPWRDGYPYQHNLAAVRECIDDHDAAFWTNNIYTGWLNSLRELSSPTTGSDFPEAMQTRAWALRTLNTQLASWTELRHDTVLYAKQSYTGMILCGYPYGYVEPRPEFWRRLGALAARTRSLLAQTPDEGFKKIIEYPDGPAWGFTTAQLKTNWTSYMDRFVAAAEILESISEKELQHVDLAPDEIEFLQNVVEQHKDYYARGYRTFGGWYPNLFYKPIEAKTFGVNEGSDMWNPVVTDVHTDPADGFPGDPGSILHEGVGNINMAFVAVDCGSETPIMYAGPILSHFEFELPDSTRKTDAEWRAVVKNHEEPTPPAWTKSFLVPGIYNLPSDID